MSISYGNQFLYFFINKFYFLKSSSNNLEIKQYANKILMFYLFIFVLELVLLVKNKYKLFPYLNMIFF